MAQHFELGIPDPKLSTLTSHQAGYLRVYFTLRSSFHHQPSEEAKPELMKSLNIFYKSLDAIQQKMQKPWFTWQLCDIDPKLIPCARMAEFVSNNNLQDSFAMSDDGQAFLLLADNQDESYEIHAKLDKTFPGLKYETISVRAQ